MLYYGQTTCSPAPTVNDPPTYVISSEFGVIGVCDANCISCKLDTNDDSYGSICVKCESGFYMKYNTDECSSTCDVDSIPDNYFGKNPQTTKCEKCSDNTNGKNYKLKDGNECISLSTNDVYHVIDDEYGIIVKCHSNCAECTEGPTANDNKCTKCKSKYFKESDSSGNCVKQCDAYLVENTVEGKCENCKLNPVEMYYYKGKCIDEQLEGTVIVDEATNGLRDCYFGCSKCTTLEFTEDDHQCLSCKADFNAEKTSSDGIYKCITDCDRSVYKWYVDSENMFYCLNEDNNNACPTTHPLLIETTNECVHTCPNDIKYDYNNNCVNACPSGYRANTQNKCVIINNNDNTSGEDEGDYSLCEERINAINTEYDSVEQLLKDQMNTFTETTTTNNIDNLVDIVTGDDITIIVFSNFTCVQHFALYFNLSYADVSTCLNKLITYHSLPQTYKFIIAQSELKRPNESTNQISGYLISDVNGNLFDLTPCKDETITVTYPLQESTLEEYNTTKEFYMETGINLYDSRASFFNDFCESFHDEHNNDVILKDRRKYMFKNASFCEEGCKYSDINFVKSVVHCECSSKENNFDTVLPNTPMDDFKYKLQKTNLKVLKCHSVFNSKRYADNAGGIVMITVMAAAVPAIVHLFVVGFNPMYTNLNSLAGNVNNGNGNGNIDNDNNAESNLQSMSKSKDKSNQLDNDDDDDNNNDNGDGNNEHNSNNMSNNNVKPNPPKKNTNTNTISSTLSNNSNLITESPSQLMNKQKNNESSTMQLAQPAKLPLKDDINEKESPISLTETNLNVLTSTKLDEKQIKNASDNLYTDEDQDNHLNLSTSESILDEAPYDDALVHDKRNILLLYWRCIQRRLFILNIIMHSSPYEPFTAKIIGVILILSFMLSLNGMFFNEGYISERYLAKDKVNGSFICKNELPKTIYSCLITIVFCYCVELVLNTRKCFKDVAKDEKDKEKFFEKTKQITKCVKIRLIVFVVVSMLLIIFFWYYISTFCGVYTKTQGGLFIGFCFSIIFFYVFQAILIFVIALMRYIGITCKCSWLYKASSFIM